MARRSLASWRFITSLAPNHIISFENLKEGSVNQARLQVFLYRGTDEVAMVARLDSIKNDTVEFKAF